jgi:RNA polymerase sigma-54 factor
VAIKQSLQIRAESQLQLTPQMRHSLRILQLSGVEIDQEIVRALECNPSLEQVEEYPENTLIDYSNSSRTVETEEATDISRTYDMGLSPDTDSDLNHVTGVEVNSTYDTVKQDAALQNELLQNLSNHRLSSSALNLHESTVCRQLTTKIC